MEKVPISRNYNIRRQYSHRHGFIFSRNSNENFENFTKSNDTNFGHEIVQRPRSKGMKWDDLENERSQESGRTSLSVRVRNQNI